MDVATQPEPDQGQEHDHHEHHEHVVVLPAFPPELEITLAVGTDPLADHHPHHHHHHHAPEMADDGVDDDTTMEPLAKRQRLDTTAAAAEAPGGPSEQGDVDDHRQAAMMTHGSVALSESVDGLDDGSMQMEGTPGLSIATEADDEAELTDGENPESSMDAGQVNAPGSGDVSVDAGSNSTLIDTSLAAAADDGLGGNDEGVRQDAQFDERLRELEEFKAKYGHCRVPQVWRDNKRLGQWVATMRNLKKASKLPQERIKLLEGIGFVWCCRNVTAANKGEKRKMVPWNERFEELKAFKDKYGHCNVPHKWSENVKLSNWLYCQRSFHRHGKLSQDKIKRLEDIGFEWSKQEPPTAVTTVVVKKRNSIHQALPFVPLPPDHEQHSLLITPVDALQQSMSLHHNHIELLQPAIGQGSTIATDQKDRLMLDAAGATGVEAAPPASSLKPLHSKGREGDSVTGDGHAADNNNNNNGDEDGEEEEVVVCQPSSVKERKSWFERFQELLAFKQTHGHCNVPWKWRENLPLFYWVRRMKDKKRSNALSADKVNLMEEIGFEWVKGQNKEKERRKQQQILIEQKQKELEEEREGLVAAAVRARLLPNAAGDHGGMQQQVGGIPATAGSVADLIAQQQQQHQQQQSVGEQGMLSPFTYNFPASFTTTGTGGALASTTYYPVYAKITSTGPAATGEYTFDTAALAASVSSGVELTMDPNAQHSLYAHAHGDLGAVIQHFMGEEMKDDKEGMEDMGALHHEDMHHHHHHDDDAEEEMHHHHHLHAMHHVAVGESDDGSVQMVEVIQNEPGHLDMSEMNFHEEIPGGEGDHDHDHHNGNVEQAMEEMQSASDAAGQSEQTDEEDAYAAYHHHHEHEHEHEHHDQEDDPQPEAE